MRIHGFFISDSSSVSKSSNPCLILTLVKCRYIENSKTARDTLKFKWKARTLADAKAMIRLQTNVKERLLKKGDIIYEEGDMGKSMYFVDEKQGGEYRT